MGKEFLSRENEPEANYHRIEMKKEIYYKAAATDSSIGAATVYRMVNLLEDIGAINRKNMYRISCSMNCNKENVCVIELDDRTICSLSYGTKTDS